MLRKRTDGQAAGDHVRSDSKKATALSAHQTQTARSEDVPKRSCWSTVFLIGKVLILIIVIPPFLNYASLQRESLLLQPKGGQLIDIGLGQKMQLLCRGQGQPVVILDAPTGMSSDIWYHVQETVSPMTKVCTYDRVGLGYSRRALLNESTQMEKAWEVSTTGRMVDDLHRLIKAAEIATPFVLVGSELGALNGRFYSHIHDTQVSDLVLLSPIPEELFQEEQWQQYWYTQLVPSQQLMQLCAALGLSRLLLIMGVMQPALHGDTVPEELLQRQKHLLCSPAHQSSAVDEHYFLNESASQVRELSVFKPLLGKTSVSVITGDAFDEQLPAHLNQMVARLQKKFLEQSYPKADHIHVHGADRRMIYKQPSVVSKHLLKLISRRQPKQQSQ